MIRIRANDSLTSLLALRDEKRNQFIHQQLDTSNRFVPMFNQAKNKAKNDLYNSIYCTIGLGIIILLLYKNLNNQYIQIILGVLTLFVFAMIFYAYLSFRKKKFIKREWDKANQIDEMVNLEANEFNKEAANEAIGVICLSENYDELTNIKDEISLKRRWLILINQYLDAINEEHNNKATIGDYLDYYDVWQKRVTGELKETN